MSAEKGLVSGTGESQSTDEMRDSLEQRIAALKSYAPENHPSFSLNPSSRAKEGFENLRLVLSKKESLRQILHKLLNESLLSCQGEIKNFKLSLEKVCLEESLDSSNEVLFYRQQAEKLLRKYQSLISNRDVSDEKLPKNSESKMDSFVLKNQAEELRVKNVKISELQTEVNRLKTEMVNLSKKTEEWKVSPNSEPQSKAPLGGNLNRYHPDTLKIDSFDLGEPPKKRWTT